MGDDLGVRDLTIIDERLASAGQPLPDQFAGIAARGYQVVIDITTPDSPGALPDEGDIVRAVGMHYLYIPVSWEAPTVASLRRFCAAMDAHRQDRVFLHCTANLRASAFLFLYRHLRLGIAEPEARLAMAQAWEPNPTWAAFLRSVLQEPHALSFARRKTALPDGAIPFYGSTYPDLYALERSAVGRDGVLLNRLRERLPEGRILEIGAGHGETARRLTTTNRTVIPLEPDRDLIAAHGGLPWVCGTAQRLPFGSGSFAGAYAQFAYFPGIRHGEKGLHELDRVLVPGAPILIADNAGDDPFSELFVRNLASDADWWRRRGFASETLSTRLRFASLKAAEELITFYGVSLGRTPGTGPTEDIAFRVALYSGRASDLASR